MDDEPVTLDPASGAPHCPACGAELSPEAMFCGACGYLVRARLSTDTPAAPPAMPAFGGSPTAPTVPSSSWLGTDTDHPAEPPTRDAAKMNGHRAPASDGDDDNPPETT